MNAGGIIKWIVVVLLASCVVWWLWPVSDETLVRRQLAQLAKWVSYGPDEVPLKKLEALGNIKKVLHAEVSLKLNMQGRASVERQGREALMESLQVVRFQVQSIQMEFLEPAFEWANDKRGVQVRTVMKAKLGEDPEQFLELNLNWIKEDNSWRLRRIETVKTWGR